MRYPIYSEWKTKSKTIKQTVKLTNEKLESLFYDEHPLIRQFAEEIISELNDEELYPSWLILRFLDAQCKEKTSELENEYLKFQEAKKYEIRTQSQAINVCKSQTKTNSVEIAKHQKKLRKTLAKLEKIAKANKSVFIAIITLGIYALLISKKRAQRLSDKRNNLNKIIECLEGKNKIIFSEIEARYKKLKDLQKEIEEKRAEINKKQEIAKSELAERAKTVSPLPKSANTNDFFPLRNFVGLEYKKIIGCYVIRNKENGRCYVGQSKDVFKRIKQHFKGTVPNNIIFAEDYYSVKDKPNLFELKIIPCATKDELDATERRLIEEYEARTKGYNGTSGNT